MTTKFNINNQLNGIYGQPLQFSNNIQTVTLATSTDTTISVPLDAGLGSPAATTNNKFIVRIRVTNSTKTVWFAVNATAEIPQGMNVFAASTSEGLALGVEYAYLVKSTDVLHFLSAAAADISVAFYSIVEG